MLLQEKEAPARPNLSSKRPTVVVPDPVKTYLIWAPFPPFQVYRAASETAHAQFFPVTALELTTAAAAILLLQSISV